MSTPLLDEPLRRVSDLANHSKPWFVVAGLLALVGGRKGKRAAITGLGAVGAASLIVNQPMKMAGERRRPDREGMGVPKQRWVRMPLSTSFPSGHSASAAAFAVSRRRRLADGPPTAACGSGGRRLLARVHRSALPQ